MLRALFKQGSFWTITNEKTISIHLSGFDPMKNNNSRNV